MKTSKILLICMLFMNTLFAQNLKKLNSNLSSPVGMSFNSNGELFIANWGDSTIKRYKEGDIKIISNEIPSPSGLAINKNNDIFVASYTSGKIYKIDKNNSVSIYLDGFSTIAGLNFDLDGNLLIAHRGKNEILKVNTNTKQVTKLVGSLSTPVGIIQISKYIYAINDIDGYVYTYNEKIKKLNLLTKEITALGIGLVNIDNEIFIPNYGGQGIYKINLDTNKLEQIETSLESPVSLSYKNGSLFIGTWRDNSLYTFKIY